MPMTTCPDCKKEISDAAAACPGCGRPMRAAEPVVVAVAPTHGKVQIEERVGLMGKRGTAFGAANFGCAALMVGAVALFVMMFIFGHMGH